MMPAYIEKDPNYQNPSYVPVTKETVEAAQNKFSNNKKRQQQLKDGRTLSKISFFSNLEDLEEVESGALVYDQSMSQGQPIPSVLGPFPKHLLGKPVDEIDRARKTERVSHDIFCVMFRPVERREVEGWGGGRSEGGYRTWAFRP